MAVEEVTPDNKQVENEPDDLNEPEESLEEPLLEPEGAPDPKPKINPLSPGGRRFEQVYAEGKQAKRDLAAERDKRIAAEAKLEALSGRSVTTDEAVDKDKEYTWAELDEFIQQGRITRADAEAHREAIMTKRIAKNVKGQFTQEVNVATRSQNLGSQIKAYCEAVPAILTEGSDERMQCDEEFDFLASIQGLDPTKIDDVTRQTLQLTALRAVYGPVDALTKRAITPVKPTTQQELPGGRRVEPSKNPDQALLDKLTKSEVAHYNKMFRAGRYPNRWKDVVEELKFEAPKRERR